MGLLKRLQFGSTANKKSSSTGNQNKKNRRKSFFFFISPSEVTEENLEVWRHLPPKIRQDPSMVSFQLQQEKLHGNLQEDEIEEQTAEQSKDDDDDDDDDSIDQSEFITMKMTDTPMANKRSPQSLSNPDEICSAELAPSPQKSTPNRTLSHDKVVSINENKSDHHLDHDKDDLHDTGQKSNLHIYTKMALLFVGWLIFTAILTKEPEKNLSMKGLVIDAGQTKSYYLKGLPISDHMIISIEGAFTTREWTNETESYITIFAQHFKKSSIDTDVGLKIEKPLPFTELWRVPIVKTTNLANASLVSLNNNIKITEKNISELDENLSVLRLVMWTNLKNEDFMVKVGVDMSPVDINKGVYYAAGLLVLLYGLIILEVVHRTFATVIVSTMSVAVLAFLDDRPTFHEIISYINMETLLLLFSMMILVAMLTETGIFDYIAVYTYKVTNGKIWPLIHGLCIITVLVSAFLDDVTTVLLMTPITIRLCEVMELNPTPVLMGIIVHANIGGSLTPVGDPSNIIITSDTYIAKHGITFMNFTFHMTVGVILVILQTFIQLRIHFWNINDLRFKEPKAIKNLRREITVWERAAASLSPFSKNGELVRQTLIKKVKILKHQLKKELACSVTGERFETTLEELQAQYPIKNKPLLIQSGISLIFIISVFIIQSIPSLQTMSLGWSALLGVILLLIITKRDDMDHLMHRIEWTTLLFFASMFIINECLIRLGLTKWIGGLTKDIIMSVDKESRLAVAIIIILWVSAITSAFVDTILITTMMVKIVVFLAENPELALPLQPLVWALAFGSCLGGNGTLYGASANVVCAGIVEQHGYKFSFNDYFKIGFPIMIGSVIVTTGYLMIAHCLFTWQ